VIDVSKFYGSDVKAISGLSASMRETYKVKGMDDSRSFITAMKSFPMKKSFRILLIMRLPPVLEDTETISIQMNQSIYYLKNDGAASC
jgi:hypothetical protein